MMQQASIALGTYNDAGFVEDQFARLSLCPAN